MTWRYFNQSDKTATSTIIHRAASEQPILIAGRHVDMPLAKTR